MNKQKQEPLAHISKRGAMPWYKAWAIRLGAIVAALLVCALLAGANVLGSFALAA